MKRFIVCVAIVVSVLVVYAFGNKKSPEHTQNNVQWMSFEQAVGAVLQAKASGQTPKLIFVDVFTDWCGWCKKMDKETFETPEIAKYLNEHFYPVKFNAEQKADINFAGRTFKFVTGENGRGYHEMAVALLDGRMSYPTTVYLNSDFQLLQRVPGYLNIETFDMILHYLAESHYTTTPWADYQKLYLEKKKQ